MRFDLNTFRFIADLNMSNGWNNYSLEDLQSYVEELRQEGMESEMPLVFNAVRQTEKFINAIASALTGDEPPAQVISGQSEQGVLERIGGPRFYRDDEGDIVLRVGTTSYETVLNEDKISIGKAQGTIFVKERTNANNEVIVNEKTGKPSLEVTAKLMIKGDRSPDAEAFYIPFMLDTEKSMTDAQVTAAVEDGELSEYLAPIPKGGATFVDLRMLPQGDYLVTDISDAKVGEYNGKEIISWNLTIPNIGIVSSRGKNLEGQLATSHKILQKKARERGVTLRISSHEVEYKTMDGEDRKVPFPNFIMDLKAGNVKNLPLGKIGNSDVKHMINAGILKDYNEETQDFAIASVGHVREILGLTGPAALPATTVAQPTITANSPMKSAVPVVEEDMIPF